jgi:hypothetical protein
MLGLEPTAIGNGAIERIALYNVLATLTGSRASAAARAVRAGGCTLTDKVVDSVAPGTRLEYEIDHATGGLLAISAATSGATVDVTAYDPEGRVAASAEVGHTPVTMLIPEAARGKWVLQVRSCGDDAPSAAFVACVGESAQSGSELTDGEVRFGPNPAGSALNVYYSLGADAELMVCDAAGRMVYSCSLPASGHQLVWDLTTKSGAPIANGLYLVMVCSGDGVVGELFRLVVQR